jgi:proteasome lid subunit RPN8/RPN11
MALQLSTTQLDEIFAHASREAPLECCGILLGQRLGDVTEVQEVRAVPNVWEGEREDRYMVDVREHVRAQREARARGLDIVGFYHSHPKGRPEPSAFDSELAWPGYSYLIVALRETAKGTAAREVKCWKWDESPGKSAEQERLIVQ